MRAKVSTLVQSRAELLQKLTSLAPLGLAGAIGGNDANFVLVPVLTKDGSGEPDSERAQRVYKALAEENEVVLSKLGNVLRVI